MKKALAWGSFALACYLFFLIATLPLAWLWPYLPLPSNVIATDVSGTLWQGRVAALQVDRTELKALRWQWQPGALFSGRLQAAFRLGEGVDGLKGKGTLGVGLAGVYLQQTELIAPVVWVKTQIPQPIPAQLDGSVTLSIRRYEHGQPWCRSLEGRLSWLQAGFRSVLGAVDLRQADAELGCRDGELTAQLSQQSAALEFNGEASLGEQGRYRVDGALKGGTDLPKGLADNLKYLGRPDPQGRYRLHFNGSL